MRLEEFMGYECEKIDWCHWGRICGRSQEASLEYVDVVAERISPCPPPQYPPIRPLRYGATPVDDEAG